MSAPESARATGEELPGEAPGDAATPDDAAEAAEAAEAAPDDVTPAQGVADEGTGDEGGSDEGGSDEGGSDEGARAAAVRDGLSVGIAVGVSGLAFGAAAVTAGLTVAQACALSLLAFTGASQFALAGVIGGGGGLVAGTLGAVLLGGRNALYGMRLAATLGVRGRRRLVTAHVVIDETAAVATAQRGRDAARAGFYTTAVTLYLAWNLTTLLGAVGAARLGDPEAVGLDVLGPAAFLALLWPRLTSGRTAVRVAVAAAVIAVAATPVLPPGVPVMLAAVAALPALLGRRAAR